MTVRQIIQEIDALPSEEQRAVFVSLQERMKATPAVSGANVVRYLDQETARPMIKEILAEHPELFRKLAQ